MKTEKFTSMEDLKQHIEESEKVKLEGRELAQQSLENYITETLDMVIIKSESLGDKNSYHERFKFTVKSKRDGFNAEYIFVSDYYDSNWFTPRENSLTLIEIKGEEGTHEVDEMFFFTNLRDESNRNDRLLTTPLSKLLSGEVTDPEMHFVVNYLKEVFEDKFGYSYTEESKGNESTFRIEFNSEIIICRGASNTIQVTFKSKGFRSTQFIFRNTNNEDLENEINRVYKLIESYFNWNVVVDGKHNLSELHDYMKSKNYLIDVSTSSLIKETYKGDYTLFCNFVISPEGYSSYKQVDTVIIYKADTGQLQLSMNYLFKETNVLCNNVNELIEKLKEVEELLS